MGGPHETVFGKLRNTANITALCSTRIYPNQVPWNAPLPAIAYLKVWDRTFHAMGRDPSVYESGFQVDILSTELGQLMTLSARVKNALRDYSGSTWGTIQRIFFDGQTEVEEIDPESRTKTQRAVQNYTVWWAT